MGTSVHPWWVHVALSARTSPWSVNTTPWTPPAENCLILPGTTSASAATATHALTYGTICPVPLWGSVRTSRSRSTPTPAATEAATAVTPPTRKRRRWMPLSPQPVGCSCSPAPRRRRARLSTKAGDGSAPPGWAARSCAATRIAPASSSAGARGGRRSASSALTKRARRRSALDIACSCGCGAAQRPQLQHLRVGDAHAHGRGGLTYGIATQETVFEDASVIGRQPIEDAAHVHLALGVDRADGVAFIVELHEHRSMALAPEVGEHAPGGGAQIGADLGCRDVAAQAWERSQECGRGHVLGVRGVAGAGVDIAIQRGDMLLVDGLPVARLVLSGNHVERRRRFGHGHVRSCPTRGSYAIRYSRHDVHREQFNESGIHPRSPDRHSLADPGPNGARTPDGGGHRPARPRRPDAGRS